MWNSAQGHQHFAIIGGGFIGAETAAALALNGSRVTMLFPAAGIGARTFPADLANFLVKIYREKGVELRPGETVRDVVSADGRLSVLTGSGAVAMEVIFVTHDFKVGDNVEWNSEAGRVRGTIQKIITSQITFKGYAVHASNEEPQYLIKSDKTDHLAMHKGSALKKIARSKRIPIKDVKPKKPTTGTRQ